MKVMDNKTKLAKLGNKNVRVYREKLSVDEYWRASYNGILTICLIRIDGIFPYFVRGISYCSPKDRFIKKKGYNIATGRAIQVLENQHSVGVISKKIAKIIKNNKLPFNWYGAIIDPDMLTEYEKKLFNI